MKDKFITLLGLTEKKNTDLIIGNLEKLGFFEAPASTRFHLDRQGGLLEHSVNVCNEAMALRESLLERHPELSDKLPLQSTIFCALMHDICKAVKTPMQFLRVALVFSSFILLNTLTA